MKKVTTVVMAERIVRMHMGATPCISAISGAGIVIIRAPILQNPIEVIVKRVGKSNAFPRYAKLKVEEIPNLVSKMKKGRAQLLSAFHPYTTIMSPPRVASPFESNSESLSPNLLKNTPERTVAAKSLKLDE
jgi:hypothetical protein